MFSAISLVTLLYAIVVNHHLCIHPCSGDVLAPEVKNFTCFTGQEQESTFDHLQPATIYNLALKAIPPYGCKAGIIARASFTTSNVPIFTIFSLFDFTTPHANFLKICRGYWISILLLEIPLIFQCRESYPWVITCNNWEFINEFCWCDVASCW